MVLYTVQKGDTLYSVSLKFGVAAGLIAVWNAIDPPYALVVGQCLLLLTPRALYTVREGDTYASVSARTGVSERELFANNPNLSGGTAPLYAGQTLVLSFEEEPSDTAEMTGYAYPFIETGVLYYSLPYISALIPFTYGFLADGTLVPLDDERLISAARSASLQRGLPVGLMRSPIKTGAFPTVTHRL